MGLVITPLYTPRRFHPLAQPLGTPQKLGGRELVWRFDGGDITRWARKAVSIITPKHRDWEWTDARNG